MHLQDKKYQGLLYGPCLWEKRAKGEEFFVTRGIAVFSALLLSWP